jgi:phage terminase large subunit GpA-like protein
MCDVKQVPYKKAMRLYVDRGRVGVTGDASGLRARLKNLGVLGRKHVPQQYLRASEAQRMLLLQGIMDGDGHAAGGPRVTVGFVDADLFASVLELIRSLGFAPASYAYPAGDRVLHRAEFRALPDRCPFRMPRKVACVDSSRMRSANVRYVESVLQVQSRPVRCIKVAADDSLFLAGEGMVPTHNTAGLLLGWMAHNVVNDPGDMLMIQMGRETARTFSKTDVDRAMRNSPKILAMKSPRVVDSNTFDTMFRHGMWMRICWPTVTNVSGSTYRYVAITDYDRIENAENVDGEGPLFDLAKKRTTTFLSRGMTLVESSPGYPVLDPAWRPATAHEAPPVGGILNLYNRSDRRRWYWCCPDCKSQFEAAPGLGLFNLPPEKVLLEEVRTANIPSMAAQWNRVVCPHCGSIIEPKWKRMLNDPAHGAIWLPDTATDGTPMHSTIAGYWMGGVAAAYQSWQSIVEQYLYGLRDYALNGSEEKLKTTTNTDQGAPYMSRHLAEAQSGINRPQDRAELDLERYVVPDWTRVLGGSVDVQGGQNARFEYHIVAIGANNERQVIDRGAIKLSDRDGMGTDKAPVDPASHAEDWDVLTRRLLQGTWRTNRPGYEMRLKFLVVDTGGEDGVTHNAYAWWRRLRRIGLHDRVVLYKGGTDKKAPVIRETAVGARRQGEKGDIPLLLCNPNLLSDAVYADLKRTEPGPGYIHLPAPRHPTLNPDGWVTQAVFDELEAETRNPDGTWTKVRKRNEWFDLFRMLRAGELRFGLDKVRDWNVVPPWLAPLAQNSEIMYAEDRRAMQADPVALPPSADVRVARPPTRARRSTAPAF